MAVKIDVASTPPKLVSYITLNSGESDIQTAFTDETYVYFGCVRARTHAFTRRPSS